VYSLWVHAMGDSLTIFSFLLCLFLPKNIISFSAKTSMSSKILGSDAEFFSRLAVNASMKVKIDNKEGTKSKLPIGNIHILKSHGGSSLDSELVDGFALNCTRASAAMPTEIKGGGVKVALLDFNLQKHKLQMGVQVVVTDTKQVEEIRQREMDITKEKIKAILDTGAKVVLTTKGIDDLCLKYFVEAGAIAVRRVKKEDMKRIAKACGGDIVATMADMEGNEAFDAANLGECEEVSEERVGDSTLLYFRGTKVGSACTVVLRGANEFMLDEMDRALHDSLCVIKRIVESNSLVAGGGAVEAALSIHLEKVATTITTREQLAVAQFAEALLVIPRTLTVNAAHDATELVARLRVHHNNAQTITGEENQKFMGLDLYEGKIRDNLAHGVVEPAISKIKSLRFAVEAAVSILRIDDMIKLNVHKEQGQ
jgi:T-complex protein 1 subunit alpha